MKISKGNNWIVYAVYNNITGTFLFTLKTFWNSVWKCKQLSMNNCNSGILKSTSVSFFHTLANCLSFNVGCLEHTWWRKQWKTMSHFIFRSFFLFIFFLFLRSRKCRKLHLTTELICFQNPGCNQKEHQDFGTVYKVRREMAEGGARSSYDFKV